ncbi:MAG: efflux RND transporter permease subunit [Pseudomonadota bacterium]
MNISAWSIRQPIPSQMLFIILMFVGLVSFYNLRIQSFPEVDLPIVTITAAQPGSTPSQLESAVTRKIEDSVANIGAVNHITSQISDGVSITTIEFDSESNPQESIEEVRDAVTRVRSDLPTDLQQPIISRLSVSGEALLTYTIEATSMDEADLAWFVDDTVTKALLSVKNVESVKRQGGVDREVRITLDPAKLLALKVTADEVSSRLRSVQQEAPGGRVSLGGREQAVRAIATMPSVEALSQLIIPLSDGRRIRLADIATVRDGAAEKTQLALLNGRPVVSFQVFRSRGASEITVAKGVRDGVAALVASHQGISISEINNTVGTVQESYDVSMSTLLEGALLAIVVVWLFLRDWRATLVSAVALPLSVIPTFFVMDLLGFTLNTVTLLALTLVVGVLVDDAIVEVENIVRHLRMGKPPIQAAIDASQEIGVAVLATSLTLVAVFLPTAFMSGISGQFFKQFGWTAAVAVMASLLVARLLTPMMSAHMLKPIHEDEHDGPVMKRYLRAVNWCLAHPLATMMTALAFFVASLTMVALLPTSLLSSEDTGQISLAIETAPGNSIEDTRRIAEDARQRLSAIKEVKTVYTLINGDVRKASLLVLLVPVHERTRSQVQVEEDVREKLHDVAAARFSIGAAGSAAKLSFVLTGDDPVALDAAAQLVVRDINAAPGFGNVTSSADVLRPEVHITPDFARAASFGVTTEAIGQAIRIATMGDYTVGLSKLNLPDRQIPIRVELSRNIRSSLDQIAQLQVQGSRGVVALANVATIEIGSGPAQITRFDRKRNINIDVELGNKVLGDAVKEIDKLPTLQHLPPGVYRTSSGDAERLQETMLGFVLAMVAGIACVYVVLVLLFEDFMQPGTIMAALPLSVGGALGFLMLLGYSMSLSAMIGLLMLMGIVTKNSILLVEYAITARREFKMERTAAIVDACHKRARPIIMTTIAMIAGMLPMALGLEGNSAFRSPMAVAVIGGLITSTILSLLVIPVVYELVDDYEQWLIRWGNRLFRPHKAALARQSVS